MTSDGEREVLRVVSIGAHTHRELWAISPEREAKGPRTRAAKFVEPLLDDTT